MALINCPECGHLMSDTSKKCPNCGYKKRSIHLNKKTFLGAFFFILGLACVFFAWVNAFDSFPYYGHGPIVIWDDFMTSNLLFGLICMPLSVIFFVLSGKFFSCLFQKSTLVGNIVSICLIAYYVIRIIIGGGFISSTEYEERQLAFQSVQSSTSNIKEDNDNISNSSNSIVGEYEFVDSDNNPWILILNEDETANLHIKNGREYYGTWDEWIDDIIWIRIPDGDAPRLNIKLDATPKSSLFINEGFIYHNGIASKSKNPRYRLSIAKTK